MKNAVIFTLKRIALLPLMFFVLATLTFSLILLIPGDPASLILGDFATDEQLEQVREDLGFNRPLGAQYVSFMLGAIQGDLGNSYLTGSSVMGELMRRLPNTLVLIVPSLLLAALIGTAIGALGAYYQRRATGRIASLFISVAQGIPPFFLGVVLIFLFVFEFRIFPTPTGMLYSSTPPSPNITGVTLLDAVLSGNTSLLSAVAAHAILPVISTAVFLAAYFAKTVRTSTTQALVQPQIEFARGCGLSEWQVIRYALLSSRTSVLTYTAILFGVSLSAQAIIEVVFSWPGAGAWALDGVLKGDLPVIQGFILVTGSVVIVAYILLDVAVALLDPRIRF